MIPVHAFEGKDVAVFGLGRSGISAARALTAGGARVLAWDDNEASRKAAQDAGVQVVDLNRRDWQTFAALVLSPGIPHRFPEPHRLVRMAQMMGVPVIGDMELFAKAVNSLGAHERPRIVGVTGTNGKSTTTALIGHILKSAGKDVRVGGNIGIGVLDLERLHAGAIYVLELSSYQLELVETLKCDVAVLLNISPDHLGRHGGMDGYVQAKRRIFRNQGIGDTAILGTITALSMCREMGPFITGVILAATVGSSMAAELGTMTVSDEVAALEVMSVDPVDYLVLPRVVALAIMCPVITVLSDLIGIYGGSVIAGTYGEVISGLHKESLQVTGTFTLQRVSEIGVLTR